MKRLLAFLLFGLGCLLAGGQVVGPRSFTNSNIIRVDVNGNDNSGIAGRSDRPFGTVTNAFTNIINGSTLLIGPGTYFCEAAYYMDVPSLTYTGAMMLLSKRNVNIVGAGQDATTIYSTNFGNFLSIYNCTNVTIKGIRFKNVQQAMDPVERDTASTILLDGTNQFIEISYCTFEDISDQAIASLYRAWEQRNLNVHHCNFIRVGQTPSTKPPLHTWLDGAAVAGPGSDCRITDNYLFQTARGIEIQEGGVNVNVVMSNIYIANNTIVSNREQAIWVAINTAARDVQVLNNTIVHTTWDWTHVGAWTNQLEGSRAMSFNMTTNLLISGNYIYGVTTTATNTRVANGIWIRGPCENVTIVGNHIQKIQGGTASISGGSGILIGNDLSAAYTVRNLAVKNNTIGGLYRMGAGIYVQPHYGSVSGLDISGNTIYDIESNGAVTFGGIVLLTGSNITLNANKVFDNFRLSTGTRNGLYVGPFVTNVVIGVNDCSGVYAFGVTNLAESGNYFFTTTDTNQKYW